ncbi:MAG: inositol monophosphatase family protein [Rhodoglobus sp.]
MTELHDAARQAVDLGVSLLHSISPGVRTAKTDRDFATEADFLIEKAVKQLLSELTPQIPFVGEEYGGNTSGTYWCLDPIDGTLNYSRGIPLHGISLALVVDDIPTLGEIALPSLGERYATGANGPTLNDAPIHVRGVSTLSEAVVCIGDFSTGKGSIIKNHTRLATITTLANQVQRIRMLGSAATDLAWLAAGRIDAVIVHSNNTWDMAAGVALAQQAGATITTLEGTTYSTKSPSLLAVAPGLKNLHNLVVTPQDSATAPAAPAPSAQGQ